MAHPLVAQGVADHSNFETDTWGRAIRTFTAMYALVYGTREQAVEMASRIHTIHTRIEGTLPEAIGPFEAGTPYRANEPELLRWVYATLVDSALSTYRDYLEPDSHAVIDQCYLEMREGAKLFGGDEAWLPPTWTAFSDWMTDTIASDEIVVSPVARQVAEQLLAGPPGLGAFSPGVRVMCAGMLCPKLREAFGLAWTRRTRVAYATLQRTLRLTVKRVPAPLRTVPVARSAYRRCRRQARSQRIQGLSTLLRRVARR